MPAYNSTIPVSSLAKGAVSQAWSAETPTPGNGGASASQQFALVGRPGQSGMSFGVDLKFSGALGGPGSASQEAGWQPSVTRVPIRSQSPARTFESVAGPTRAVAETYLRHWRS